MNFKEYRRRTQRAIVLCERLEKIKRQIAENPTPARLSAAITVMVALHVAELERSDLQIADLARRLALVEKRLGLGSVDSLLSGAVRRGLRGRSR